MRFLVKSSKRRMGGNGLFIPILGFASCVAFIYLSLGDIWPSAYPVEPAWGFVQRNGTRFMLDGKPFYVNGWNSYWLMDHSADDERKHKSAAMLEAGSKMGLTVCRTWAFNDGAHNALQVSPGRFEEKVFRALDHVIAQARAHKVRLILSLVNNLQAYGGKDRYVKWAWEEGIGLSSSNDSFFYDPSIKKYFKHYLQTMLTRKNTLTGIEYRNDPTIFAWELMNEPRCMTDPSGDTLQDWIEEMSAFVKSIDTNHQLTVGLEGFYGPKNPKRLTVNPADWAADLGSDFIRNSKVPHIDFASVHIYPDHWVAHQSFEDKLKFVSKWMLSHIEDGHYELNKPVLFTEFGLSNLNKDFQPSQRDSLYKTVYDIIYKSAKRNRAGAGALMWQLFVEDMDESNDDFGIVPWETKSTYKIITEQSCKLAKLHGSIENDQNLKELCLRKQ
ncbi:Mannan endo-1,4-beta-mannosidase 2 [Linum perenne]